MNNPFEDTNKLFVLSFKKQALMAKRIDVIVELNEENYYNLDNTHLALLERLKTIDDQIKKLESDEKYIRGVETSNLVQNHLNNIDSICGFKDDPQITSDEWEKMRELGK